jgi:hypothetical protein
VTCGRSVVYSGYSGFLHQWTDIHDIPEILLKVALNTITLTSEIIILLNLDLDNLIIWDEVPIMVEIAICSNKSRFLLERFYCWIQFILVITNKMKTNNLRTNFRGDVHIVYITLHFDEAIIIFVFYISSTYYGTRV